ncbi:voltage-gated ion channel protein [Chloropicon primus]|uniref:Voltage-gated ion channel protein n=1 Tax=Chloropicon primus TaxID=1764295 RepID=A0A5B8MX69_9CHLO|nr:voltage-gated ion channel protein [Chloropicon primus]UPR04384.1 voltage-gated ion channel protein [Chloropicon primus]|eukprot:QDZ25179.1 voltage-gated ion channel protein [Chloropicon primus]
MLIFLEAYERTKECEIGKPLASFTELADCFYKTYPELFEGEDLKPQHFYLRHKEHHVYYEGFKLQDVFEGAVVECRAPRKAKPASLANFVKRKQIMDILSSNQNRKTGFREKLWTTLDDPGSSRLAGTITLFLLLLILLSTVNFCLETLPYFYTPSNECDNVWCYLECICISCFTVEIGLRLFSCPSYRMYFQDWMNIIDIVAVVPFYLEAMLMGVDIPGFAVFRVVRLVRVFRLLKMSRSSISIFVQTMKRSAKPLFMLIFFTSIATIIFSSLMYYFERGTYDHDLGVWKRLLYYSCPVRVSVYEPDLAVNHPPNSYILDYPCLLETSLNDQNAIYKCPYLYPKDKGCTHIYEQSPYDSIPATFWWCLVTMTTVGYGDMYPTRWYGRLLGMIVMVFGIVVLALPITVIGSNFHAIYDEYNQEVLAKGRVDYLDASLVTNAIETSNNNNVDSPAGNNSKNGE